MTTRYTHDEWLAIIERAKGNLPSSPATYKAPNVGSEDFAKMIDHTLLKLDATKQQIDELCEEARRFREAAKAIKAGATELDMVINYTLLKQGLYSQVYSDIAAVRNVAPHPVVLKVILETAQLSSNEIIAACKIAEAAQADFVKTSTGFNGKGATRENVQLMKSVVGGHMKVKASGGVKTVNECILRVSKAIRDEATPIMYSRNTFTTAVISDAEFARVYGRFLGPCEGPCEGPRTQGLPSNHEEPLVKDMWEAARHDLVRDVGKIFDTDIKTLPSWLFIQTFDEQDVHLEFDCKNDLTCQLPAFLRQIGQQNTAMIEGVKIQFGDMVYGAYCFPMYAEILRQHFPNLRRLLVDFNCISHYRWHHDCIRWGLEMHGAMIALFEEIRTLFKDITTLTELLFFDFADGFEEIANAIKEEKLRGTAFDLPQLFGSITPNFD
ncbi:deoxyribose-phosphate aldolase, partial [Lecanoromycetidae sp. Uapishka_2]